MRKPFVLLAILSLAAMFLSSCIKNEKDDQGLLKIVTTTGMIADVAGNIGGDKVSAISLMGPGVDPHLYKASEGDVSRLSGADLILFNGLHLESKMGEVLERFVGNTVTVPVAEVISNDRLIEVSQSGSSHDPHVWFDVDLWIDVSGEILRAMIEANPENSDYFTKRHQEYQRSLEELNIYVSERTAQIPAEGRVLVTAHDAFGYFGNAYGFEVRGLQGISTVSEAGTADVRSLADYIAEKKIPAIFIESSVPRKNVEALQAAVESRGHEVVIGGELFSDAMGDEGTVEGTYLGMVRHNVDTIVDALLGKGE